MTTGKRIRDLRVAARMTQAELARKLELSPSAVGMYEQGRRQPDPETVLALCRLFETSADWLLFGQGGVRAEPKVTTDVAALLEQWRAQLMAQAERLFFQTAENRRLILGREGAERLWQAVRVAAEVALRR